MSTGLFIALILIALVGGACITTIGPGGIFVTIALFVLLDMGPSEVAGTASATFIATGIVGSLAYLRSGQLATRQALRSAVMLSVSSVIGAFLGAQLNTVLDAEIFGLLLGAFVLMTSLIIIVRSRSTPDPAKAIDLDGFSGQAAMLGVGLAVGLPGGLLGVGGPVLAVPLLVVLGVPMLLAVALAQVQSIFIAAFATVGYAMHGAVDWALALLVGVPLLVGTVAGWVIARRTRPEKLKAFLAIVLFALGVYLLLGGGTPT